LKTAGRAGGSWNAPYAQQGRSERRRENAIQPQTLASTSLRQGRRPPEPSMSGPPTRWLFFWTAERLLPGAEQSRANPGTKSRPMLST